jgi:hypothetical protein
MIEELISVAEKFERLDEELTGISRRYSESVGVTRAG